MTQWVINRGDSHFSVDGLSELARLAKQGDIDAGDLIQPEGAEDWLYAIEIPELAGIVQSDLDDDDIPVRRGGGAAVKGILYGVFGLMILGGIAGMVHFYGQLPTGDESLLGEGGALKYTELIVLTDASLYAEPDEKSASLAIVPKDSQAELLAKRAAFYKARYEGKEGWLKVDDTLAVYQMGDEKIKRKLDPLYNPDQYTKVTSASFTTIEDDENNIGTFRFQLENSSDYNVTDLVLLAVIKDSKGAEVASQEFPIEGFIPAKGGTMVGTLPPTEDELKAAEKAEEEPPPSRLMTYSFFEQEIVKAAETEEEQEELYLRFKDGLDIQVDETFTEAEVRIVELRAAPE